MAFSPAQLVVSQKPIRCFTRAGLIPVALTLLSKEVVKHMWTKTADTILEHHVLYRPHVKSTPPNHRQKTTCICDA